MGEIANQMINGEICAMCGCFLEPEEIVYSQVSGEEITMDEDGEGVGFPVLCSGCGE